MKHLVLLFLPLLAEARFTPDWDSLDSRPLPRWYDDAKIGIFMHFGPYAVPGVSGAWLWNELAQNDSSSEGVRYMRDFMPPRFTYQDFGPMLKMEFFNATDMARIVAESGAKYFVFTSKHHDGYCNWNSSYSHGWNSMAVGPKRNVVRELREAFASHHPDVHFGLYYSLYEWFHPLYLKDKANGFRTREYALNKMLPEMRELVDTFKPHVLWSDGDWEADPDYWGSRDFLAWLYNESPSGEHVVTNDRWGAGTTMKHGGFYSGSDRFNPGVLQSHKFENCMTVDRKAWASRRNIRLEDVMSIGDLIATVASTVSCGGNILVNVGPTSQGTIIPIFEERLRELGQWLRVNGEAIYGSRPWTHQNDTASPHVWYTSKENNVYAIVLEWPEDDVLPLSSPSKGKWARVTMLGVEGELKFTMGKGRMRVRLPSMGRTVGECGRACAVAPVLRLEGLKVAGEMLEEVEEIIVVDNML